MPLTNAQKQARYRRFRYAEYLLDLSLLQDEAFVVHALNNALLSHLLVKGVL